MSLDSAGFCSRLQENFCSEVNYFWGEIKKNSGLLIPSLTIFKGFSYFADLPIFETKIPKEIKNIATLINESNICGNLINQIDFILTLSKISKNIEERKKAKESGDCVKILDADLSAVRIAGKCFNFINIATNFINKHFISDLATAVGKVCSVASLVFSFAEIVQHKLHYDTTHQLMKDLKRERHLAFIKTYFEKMQLSPPKEPAETLSSAELKKCYKELKCKLKNAKEDTLLSDISKVANQAFVNALTDKMKADPEIFSTHFNAQIKGRGTAEESSCLIAKLMPPSPKLEANFKERLSSLAANGEAKKLSSAVKLLKQQGRSTERSHIFSIGLSGINCTNSTVKFALGTINPLILPISIGISVLTSGASIAQHFVNEAQSEKFVNAMEKVLA